MQTELNPFRPPTTDPVVPPHVEIGEIMFGGSMTREEAGQFETLIQRKQPKSVSKLDWWLMGILLAATSGSSLFFMIVYDEWEYLFDALLGVAVIGSVMLAVTLKQKRSQWQIARLQAENKGVFTNVTGQLQTNRIRFLVDDYPVEYRWEDFVGYRLLDNVAVLYVDYPAEYNFLAASYFDSPADWILVSEAIQANLTRIPNKAARGKYKSQGKMPYVLLGTRQLVTSQWASAVAAFDQALLIDPADLQALRGRGVAAFHLGDYHSAVSSLDEAVQRGAPDAMTLRLRSVVLLALENYERALMDLDELIRRTREDADVLRDRGLALQKLERFEEALQMYDATIQRNDQDGIAFNNRGATLLELGRPQEAIPDLQRAMKLVPEIPNPRNHLARAQAMLTDA